MRVTYPDQRWSVDQNTVITPTDAYGTIEFLGGPHPTKAQVGKSCEDFDLYTMSE